jgi:hypothetical protein
VRGPVVELFCCDGDDLSVVVMVVMMVLVIKVVLLLSAIRYYYGPNYVPDYLMQGWCATRLELFVSHLKD